MEVDSRRKTGYDSLKPAFWHTCAPNAENQTPNWGPARNSEVASTDCLGRSCCSTKLARKIQLARERGQAPLWHSPYFVWICPKEVGAYHRGRAASTSPSIENDLSRRRYNVGYCRSEISSSYALDRGLGGPPNGRAASSSPIHPLANAVIDAQTFERCDVALFGPTSDPSLLYGNLRVELLRIA